MTQLIAGAGGARGAPPVYTDGRVQKYAAVSGALQLDLLGDVRTSPTGPTPATWSTPGPSAARAPATRCRRPGRRGPGDRDLGDDATLSVGAVHRPVRLVAGYRVRRNGRLVATVGAGTTSWADSGLASGATYVWTVDAFDPSENISAQSVPTSVTMPAAPRPKVKAKQLLAGLRGAGETPRGFRRALFGSWADADGDGCSTAPRCSSPRPAGHRG